MWGAIWIVGAMFLPVGLVHGQVTRPAGQARLEPQVTLQRHFSPDDRAAGRYQYLGFDVPDGARRIHVVQTYDRAGGVNAIDLGLFEPGSLDLGSRALRGWSGGARTEIVLTPDSATPGYRPGPLAAGRWHVILQLYKVAPAGADVTVTISIETEPAAGAARQWYAGDLHLHTVHSDGSAEPAELLAMAGQAGLQFAIITDHNNTTHALGTPPGPAAKGRPLHIVGEEVTTPGGHANVWGLRAGDVIDFRVSPGDPRIHDLAAAAQARGGLFVINHPFAECDACDWRHPIPAATAAIEVWNGPFGPQPKAVALWDDLLRSGRRITGVAASDWHRPPAPLGAGSVRVLSEDLTEASILRAIAAGAVIMMREPTSPPPSVTVTSAGASAGVGETLRPPRDAAIEVVVAVPPFTSVGLGACPSACAVELFWNGEKVDAAAAGTGRVTFSRRAAEGYFRVSVTSGATTVALTNPVYVSVQ